MKQFYKELAVISVGSIIAIGIMYYTWPASIHGVRVYNCSIAEISPDFPIDVREECRKARMEQK